MGNFKKDIFGEDGMLHRYFGEGYEMRDEQSNMSIAVVNAIHNRDILFAEGATGVGKSFAYLIPAVSPTLRKLLESRGIKPPVVISTSTKVLQDQVFQKDAPTIIDATGQELKLVLAKGRNNYVSVRRLNEYIKDINAGRVEFEDKDVATGATELLNKLCDWLSDGESSDFYGEFADFEMDVPYEIKQAIESDSDDCHQEACRHHSECPYYRQRAKRESSDILIVNHALLAIHLMTGMVLPNQSATFIIDEAHKFYESVSNVFTIDLTLRSIERFLNTFRNRLGKLREKVLDEDQRTALIDALNSLEKRRKQDSQTAAEFFGVIQDKVKEVALSRSICSENSERFGYAIETPSIVFDELDTMLIFYEDVSRKIASEFGVDLEISEDNEDDDSSLSPEEKEIHDEIKSLISLSVGLRCRVQNVLTKDDPETYCYWTDVAPIREGKTDTPYRLTLHRTPIDITEYIAPLYEGNKAVIFTSATLQVAGSFNRIQKQFGLPEAIEQKDDEPVKQISTRVYPSPFPYKDNVEIHLFGDALLDRPTPGASDDEKEAYFEQQACLVEYYCRLRGGRALVLCSSNLLMHELYTRLEDVFEDMGVNVFQQSGTDRLKETVETFKADETSVLFGVASCWEGLDAPGPTLETVIIPQLPFAPPHPLLDARQQLLPNPEQDKFWQILLPDMLLRLKQGAGRLVRSSTDRGVIAILSPRPLTKGYRRAIQKALPPGKIVKNPVEALRFLAN